LTPPLRLHILSNVNIFRFSNGSRRSMLLALLVLGTLLLGAASGLVVAAGEKTEDCIDCTGCETGRCDGEDENPLESHHHCCTVCCISHTSVALVAVLSSPGPVVAESLPAFSAVALTGCTTDTPYRPPRV
jgi:hypothetical protein